MNGAVRAPSPAAIDVTWSDGNELRFSKNLVRSAASRLDEGAGFDDLLHPAWAFARPSDVVDDPDLTLNEKRAILASWASDACAAEANPLLRQAADGETAKWDDVMDALKELDLRAADSADGTLPSRAFLVAASRPEKRTERRAGSRVHVGVSFRHDHIAKFLSLAARVEEQRAGLAPSRPTTTIQKGRRPARRPGFRANHSR